MLILSCSPLAHMLVILPFSCRNAPLPSPHPVNGPPTPHLSVLGYISHSVYRLPTRIGILLLQLRSLTPPKSDPLVKFEHKTLTTLLMFSGSSQANVHMMDEIKAFPNATILRILSILFFFLGVCAPALVLFVPNPSYDLCNQ